jgi:putative transposase
MVKARVDDIDLQERGGGEVSDVVKATTATPGEYHATRPLEIVQIDHGRRIVVDEQTREPPGRLGDVNSM